MTDDYASLLNQLKIFSSNLPSSVTTIRRVKGDFSDSILPFELYRGKRDNITKIGDQINKAYEHNICDGCAVLMRRLVEMLLILSYKAHHIENEIRDANGRFFQLSDIINNAIQNPSFDLTSNGKEYLGLFKDKGNLSAHNPFHNALKKDIELLQPKFRHLIEELFYISNIM